MFKNNLGRISIKYCCKIHGNVQEIKKDPQFNNLNESEVFETANELALYEAGNYAE